MSGWFLDASVFLAAEDADDDNHVAAQELLRAANPLGTLDLAFYEASNVAIRSWPDVTAAQRLRERVHAVGEDGGLVRADFTLAAADLAQRH